MSWITYLLAKLRKERTRWHAQTEIVLNPSQFNLDNLVNPIICESRDRMSACQHAEAEIIQNPFQLNLVKLV